MKLLLILPILLIFTSCDPVKKMEAECTKVEKVLNCADDNCRVLFENGQRYTTRVAAKGDIYCRRYKIRESGQIADDVFNDWWLSFNDYSEVCKNSSEPCIIVKK